MSTLSEKIQALLTYANGISGKADTTLGDAVKSLGDGFGGGGMEFVGVATSTTDSTYGTLYLPTLDINGFHIYIAYDGENINVSTYRNPSLLLLIVSNPSPNMINQFSNINCFYSGYASGYNLGAFKNIEISSFDNTIAGSGTVRFTNGVSYNIYKII